MPDSILLEKRDDGVAVITNDDEPLNRLTLAFVEEVWEAVDDVASDDSIRALVVTAEGTANFSVGMDLKQLADGIAAAGSVDAFFDRRLELIARIETMGKPSVATLFGNSLGGGLELALGCTFRLAASDGARIGLPELDLGSTPAWGGSARLARTVGRQHRAGHDPALEDGLRSRGAGHRPGGPGLAARGARRTAPSISRSSSRARPDLRSGGCSTPSTAARSAPSTTCWP